MSKPVRKFRESKAVMREYARWEPPAERARRQAAKKADRYRRQAMTLKGHAEAEA